MTSPELDIVTGVSGFTGRHIARLLLARGRRVLNLTGHPDRPTDFGDSVASAPFRFDNPERLAESIAGASVLYNTYWIRFPRGQTTFERAVANSKTLIGAAKRAGLRRVVHISIANPSQDSKLPYYRGKALVERAIVESGLSHAILRPTVIFGDGGILINNIAWFLRRLAVFAVPGSGEYRLRPIFVEDLAGLAVSAGERDDSFVIDAVGPEAFTFNDLLRLIADAVGSRCRIIHLNPNLALAATTAFGYLLRDVVLTRDEIAGLTSGLLASDGPPTGQTRFTEWLAENSDRLGRTYLSEIARHYR